MEVFNEFDESDFPIFVKIQQRKSNQGEEKDLISSSPSVIEKFENENKKSNLITQKNESKRIKDLSKNLIVTATHNNNKDSSDLNKTIIIVENKAKNKNKNTSIRVKKHLSNPRIGNSITQTTTEGEALERSTEQTISTVFSSSLSNNSLLSTTTTHITKDLKHISNPHETKNLKQSINNKEKSTNIRKELKSEKIIERSIDEEIRSRYQQYFELETKQKDQSKTDYTYAHSYSYSPLVPIKEQYNWTVPNMSRLSVRHRGTMPTVMAEDTVIRRFVGNVPVSQIKTSKVDTHLTKQNNIETVFHSTPLKPLLRSNLEFSDDDDELNQTVRNISMRPKRTFKHTTFNADNGDNGQWEEEEEEQLTIIRRIQRFINTITRSIFTPNVVVQNYIVSSDTNDDLPSSSNHLQYSNMNHQRQLPTRKNSIGTCLSNLSWFTTPTVDNDENYYKKMFWCRWPLWLFFLLLLFLLLSSTYLFSGSSGSSYYKLLHLNDDSKFLQLSTTASSSFITSLISLLSWPKFLFDTLWAFLLDSHSSSSIITNHDLSHLTAEIFSLKEELLSIKNDRNIKKDLSSSPNINELLEKITRLESKLISCCLTNGTNEIEDRIRILIDNKMFAMQQRYDSQMKTEIDNVTSYLIRFIHENYTNLNNSIAQIKSDNDSQNISTHNGTNVEKMIQMAIAKYDADKTGEADFALESSGAWILNTRCTKTYSSNPSVYRLFGFPVWREVNTPRVVIQSGVVPGECWCFEGSEGRIAIHLSARIIPTAFHYEHIPMRLSTHGNIFSAPNHFIVYGLRSEDDLEPEILGKYYYRISSPGNLQNYEPLQRFPVQNIDVAKHTFDKIEMSVKSNHGNLEYTCLYRFRVHGTLPISNSSSLFNN